ncbi:alpha/beta fold hydrolase [Microbacterium sp.]|uniref:alpha/beta fold hydrolase n=1 Tax=Microbacterium sp. TaxID=51671 RepID=UPI00289D48FC|nr:alpha/beta fold hydrolase [Microbacterium sp.]
MTALIASDGVRLDYTESGDAAGRPLLLIAGFKAAATSWRYQVPPLAAAGYRVIAADIRGHGVAERADAGGSRSADGPLRAVQGTIRAPSVGRQRVSASSGPSRCRSRR